MRQIDVLDYVLTQDCYIYEQRNKEDGIHYFVRKNGFKTISVIYPVKNDGIYKKLAVCHICNTLGIDVHPYAQSHQEMLDIAKNKISDISEADKEVNNK